MKRNHLVYIFTIAAFALLLLFNGCEMDKEEVQVDWKTSTYESMTFEQKVGQMFCLTVDPIRYFFYPQYKKSINTLVSKYSPGALYLSTELDSVKKEIRLEFNGHKLHEEIVDLQRQSTIPLLVGADFNSGAWSWDNKATRFNYPLALSAIGSGEYSFRQGKITAVEANAQGINWLQMPNSSINSGMSNIMLLLDSLGDDPVLVSDLSTQIIRGIQEARTAATTKYYPNPALNSLLSYDPALMSPEQTTIFQSAVNSKVATILTAPVDPETAPDSANEAWQSSLSYLIDTLGYQGIVTTEFRSDLSVDNAGDELGLMKVGIDAGTVLFILPEVFGTEIPIIDLLISDVVSSRYETTRIDAAVKTIIEEKFDIGLNLPKVKQSIMYMSGLGLPEYFQNSRDIASEALTVLKNDDDIMPIDTENSKVVSFTFLDDASFSFSTIFRDKLRERADTISHIDIFGPPDMRIRRELIRRAEFADVVLLSFFYKPIDDNGTVFPKELSEALKEISKANKNVIVTSYFDPTLINILPAHKAYIIPFSPSEFSMEAALDLVLGENDAHGKLPFHMSEEFPLGFGLSVNR